MNCPFCNPDPDRKVLAKNGYAFAVPDMYPVCEGHALVIPFRHVESFFNLKKEEQQGCLDLLNGLRDLLEDTFEPEGFNIGLNDGRTAGQTIGHAHIHVIPRFSGDVEDPTGGVRGVIPGKAGY